MTQLQRGFSLLEFSVVAVVLVVLSGVFLERLTYYQEAAERARFESELQIFKTGLQLRMAELISTNREQQIRQLETENPLRWLDQKPAYYAGEYPLSPESGAWYFDSVARELVYVVNQDRFLSVENPVKPKQLRFRVRVNYQPVDAPGGRIRGLAGVTLEPVSLFRWL
jgi:prepilin-type N-terminal cleavage/methylation domain-containing protein